MNTNNYARYLNVLSFAHYLYGSTLLIGTSLGVGYLMGYPVFTQGMGNTVHWIATYSDRTKIAVILLTAILLWTLSLGIILAGRKLQERKSRTYCMLIASLTSIPVLPLGPAFGALTLSILIKRPVKAIFLHATREVRSPDRRQLNVRTERMV